MLQTNKLVVLYLLAAMFVVNHITTVRAEGYQPVQLRPLTEVEQAKLMLFEKLNSDVNKYNTLSRVFQAESEWKQEAYNSETGDVGIAQINLKYHLQRSQEMGYDIYTYQGNIDYALVLYKESGLQPWSASRGVWSKNG